MKTKEIVITECMTLVEHRSRAYLLEVPLLVHGDYVAVNLGILLQVRGGGTLALGCCSSGHLTRKTTSLEKGDTGGPLSKRFTCCRYL